MDKIQNHPRTPRDGLRLFLTGIAMGSADVIPGVSGGTMAFILGIYEDLLLSIKSFDLHLLKLLRKLNIKQAMEHVPWQFLLAVLFGIATAILSLAHLVSWLLDNQPEYLFAFFFGLILASVVAIGATLTWNMRTIGMLIIGTIGRIHHCGACAAGYAPRPADRLWQWNDSHNRDDPARYLRLVYAAYP